MLCCCDTSATVATDVEVDNRAVVSLVLRGLVTLSTRDFGTVDSDFSNALCDVTVLVSAEVEVGNAVASLVSCPITARQGRTTSNAERLHHIPGMPARSCSALMCSQ